MAQSKAQAIAEGMADYLEQVAEAVEAYGADCNCCCCTGECTYTYRDLEEIEVQLYYGEIERWPF